MVFGSSAGNSMDTVTALTDGRKKRESRSENFPDAATANWHGFV